MKGDCDGNSLVGMQKMFYFPISTSAGSNYYNDKNTHCATQISNALIYMCCSTTKPSRHPKSGCDFGFDHIASIHEGHKPVTSDKSLVPNHAWNPHNNLHLHLLPTKDPEWFFGALITILLIDLSTRKKVSSVSVLHCYGSEKRTISFIGVAYACCIVIVGVDRMLPVDWSISVHIII